MTRAVLWAAFLAGFTIGLTWVAAATVMHPRPSAPHRAAIKKTEGPLDATR